MEMLINLVIQLISGVVGGNAVVRARCGSPINAATKKVAPDVYSE